MFDQSQKGLGCYTETFRILDAESDMNAILTPGGLLRISQQVATSQCTLNGMDFDFYDRMGAVFIVMKMAVHLDRPIKAYELITVDTRPQQSRHGIYKRINRFYDESGTQIGMCDGRWMLFDTREQKVLRHDPEMLSIFPFNEEVEGELPFNLPRRTECEPVGTMHAALSLCDTNHHVNNTRYADIAMDALPENVAANAMVSDIMINFRSQIPYGADFQVSRALLDDGRWLVVGDLEGKRAFEVCLTLFE